MWGRLGMQQRFDTQRELHLFSAGIADHVEITEGQGGLPKVVLKHSCGSKAEVYFGSSVVCNTPQHVAVQCQTHP